MVLLRRAHPHTRVGAGEHCNWTVCLWLRMAPRSPEVAAVLGRCHAAAGSVPHRPPACLPACLHACLPACMPACLPACLPACSLWSEPTHLEAQQAHLSSGLYLLFPPSAWLQGCASFACPWLQTRRALHTAGGTCRSRTWWFPCNLTLSRELSPFTSFSLPRGLGYRAALLMLVRGCTPAKHSTLQDALAAPARDAFPTASPVAWVAELEHVGQALLQHVPPQVGQLRVLCFEQRPRGRCQLVPLGAGGTG